MGSMGFRASASEEGLGFSGLRFRGRGSIVYVFRVRRF